MPVGNNGFPVADGVHPQLGRVIEFAEFMDGTEDFGGGSDGKFELTFAAVSREQRRIMGGSDVNRIPVAKNFICFFYHCPPCFLSTDRFRLVLSYSKRSDVDRNTLYVTGRIYH